jgi:hypothetical protein
MKRWILFICLCSFASLGRGEDEVRIIVHAGSYDRADCIVSVAVPGLGAVDDDSMIELTETTTGRQHELIPCQ